MNTSQKTTKTGKPIINRKSKLPEFSLSVHTRIMRIKKELGIVNNKPNHDQIWTSICINVSLLKT